MSNRVLIENLITPFATASFFSLETLYYSIFFANWQ
nr:MAG TPA: hypothetical protein [Bacteriophage sp.]